MDASESRIVELRPYPKMVFAETLVFFFGANFLYHQNVFRRTANRPGFALFMLVNAFTSFQLAEATNVNVLRYYGCHINNKLEIEHRAEMNTVLRTRLYGKNPQ